MSKPVVASSIIASLLLGACIAPPSPAPPKHYDRPLPPGRRALRRITDPRRWPPLEKACRDRQGLEEALAASIRFLNKPSSHDHFPCCGITHRRALAGLELFRELLAAHPTSAGLARAIRVRFDLYLSVGCDGRGTVLFTGYYTPIFAGALAPTSRYRHPLYRPPAGLVKAENGTVLGIRGEDGAVLPCPPRSRMDDSGLLAGCELVWLADPFAAYIAHVQGSARIRLPDGRIVTVGYAACNGHPYRSLAREMVARGLITADNISLNAMIDWFRAHPHRVEPLTDLNPRYVFFRFQEGPPRGCLNEPVTARRTIATDKSIFPPASLTLVSTSLPARRGERVTFAATTRFTFDQDRGGAIKAPGRCDIYMGMGREAGILAGRTMQEGHLYYLFPR